MRFCLHGFHRFFTFSIRGANRTQFLEIFLSFLFGHAARRERVAPLSHVRIAPTVACRLTFNSPHKIHSPNQGDGFIPRYAGHRAKANTKGIGGSIYGAKKI